MIESKYFARFKKLREEGKELFTLPGNRMVIEILPKEEIKKGAIVIASSLKGHRTTDTEENRAMLGLVLLTGSGYYDEETGEDVPMDYAPGSVVLVSNMGVKYYSQFPGLNDYTENSIALTRDSEVHLAFPSLEHYEKVKVLLNE